MTVAVAVATQHPKYTLNLHMKLAFFEITVNQLTHRSFASVGIYNSD